MIQLRQLLRVTTSSLFQC